MCGIVGLVNLDKKPVSPVALKKMTDLIKHRGPDGYGLYVDKNIGLGHRRLAIIDLSPKGHQPMQTRDLRFVITYNGEVYNFINLRIELESKGYIFHSNTDTEVVLKSFQQWGIDSFLKFNGMFAFAILDRKSNYLYVVRDRYGIKPLYYYIDDNIFLFSSEIKAFLSLSQFKVKLDYKALIEYFTFQNIFTDRTLFKDVKVLKPGHYLKLDLNNNKISLKQYWDFKFKEDEIIKDYRDYKEQLDFLFNQAVKRQLVSDVEIGAYLSGGIDSGAITSISSKYFKNLKTFCIGYDRYSSSGLELSFDERDKAEYISYLNRTEHYEMVLKSGDMERCIKDLVWHLEDLRVGQSYPNYYVSKLASRFVKVVLSGAGGDELFAGYPWRYYRTIKSSDFEEYIDNYYLYWQRLIPNKLIKRIFLPIYNEVKDVWTRDIFKQVFNYPISKINTPEEYINHSLYFEAKTFLHGLLIVEDKLSMAHSLEVRVPFLDNDLVDFALKIPVKYKLKNIDNIMRINENEIAKLKKYFEKTNDGKIILRDILRKYVPLNIVKQIKQGFSAPDALWFKGDSIEYVKNIIFNKKSRIYEFLDRKSTQEIVNEHLQGKINRRLFIWSLINFEQWLELFL